MSYDYNNLNVGKLDYASIKNNLTNFLKQYPQFQDYDFDNTASAVNLFLDILSANTAYNGYYLHSVLTNSFPITSTTKRALFLNANLRGAFVADTVSARTTLTVKNNASGATVIPRLSTISATQANGNACSFYNLEEIPVTSGEDTVAVEAVSGKAVNQYSNFDVQTKTLEVPLIVDPTCLKFAEVQTDGLTKVYWTQVNKFSNTTSANIFTAFNGPNTYYVTTNIAGANTPLNTIIVYGVVSNGSAANSATIRSFTSYPSVQIVSYTSPSGGIDTISKDYLKTYMPYLSATNDRIVTQKDYVDSIYMFMTNKGFTINKDTISITTPSAGLIRIYIPDLPSTSAASSAINELLTSYLATRKIAGISVEYGV
jgi:hypothetical protein